MGICDDGYRALHRFLECAYGLTSQHCGENGKNASEFLRSYTEKAVGSLITSTCRKLPAGNRLGSGDNRVMEIDEADGLREVSVEEHVTTILLSTSTKPTRPSRRGSKKGAEGRRSKATTTPLPGLPGLPGNLMTSNAGAVAGKSGDTGRSQKSSNPQSLAGKSSAVSWRCCATSMLTQIILASFITLQIVFLFGLGIEL